MDDAKAPLYLVVSIYEFVFDCIHSCTPPLPQKINKNKQTNKNQFMHEQTWVHGILWWTLKYVLIIMDNN